MPSPPAHDVVITTHDWPARKRWTAATDLLPLAGLSAPAQVRALLQAARRYRVLVLNGSLEGKVQPSAAALIGRLPKPPQIVLTDCTWKAGEGVDRLLRRAAITALDGRHVTYCVLSTFEREQFPRTWGVDPERVRFTPWYVGLPDEQLGADPPGDDGHVFAGGDSLRDYGPLLAAAPRLKAPLVIAARTLDPATVPPGVQAGALPEDRYAQLAARAATVVVALEARLDRSAGQFTYLNAMAQGKPVVVTDAPGVRDYVEHERTGLVVPPGDADALAAAVNWTVAPETRPEALAMGLRARDDVLARFGPERYIAALLDVVDEVRRRA